MRGKIGGESLEMSFRTWMCHGRLDIIPCSKVGHIFRTSVPYQVQEDAHGLNTRRTAEFWMGEYKRLYFIDRRDLEEEDNEHHDHLEGEPERRLIQMSNECHDFNWYLKNVATNKFILDEDLSHHGKIKSGAYEA